MHFHLLPRKLHGDRFAGQNDEVYPALERAEQELGVGASAGERLVPGGEPIKMDADEDRKPRSMEEMVQEAEWLKGFFDGEDAAAATANSRQL